MAKNALRDDMSNPEGATPTAVAEAPSSPGSAPRPLPLINVAKRQGILRRLDGSFLMELVIEVEEALLLESWAETAGEPLEAYIQTQVTEALRAWCSQQAG